MRKHQARITNFTRTNKISNQISSNSNKEKICFRNEKNLNFLNKTTQGGFHFLSDLDSTQSIKQEKYFENLKNSGIFNETRYELINSIYNQTIFKMNPNKNNYFFKKSKS